jgi:calcineurin-like phosphoesterase family protein
LKAVNNLPENDLLINLGDLVDGEFTESDELKEVINNIKCNKILVRGNNDLFDKRFYKSCGFLYVIDSFIWKDILFSHMPIKNDNELNIHGHTHGFRTYWVPYTNQIDVGAFDGRVKPVKLNSILGKQKAYAKTIKEEPEHFDESARIKMNGDMFTFVMFSLDKNFIPDPFED